MIGGRDLLQMFVGKMGKKPCRLSKGTAEEEEETFGDISIPELITVNL